MSIITTDPITIDQELVLVAQQLVFAAITAPKARGLNCLESIIITGEEIIGLSKEMKKIGESTEQHFFIRDAENILKSPAIILLGAKIEPRNLKECRYCGFSDCGHKLSISKAPCVHNITDLGIAIGAVCSLAADHRIDNRVMFSAGRASLSLNYFTSEIAVAYAIPLSVSSKNIFFDRG